MKKFISGVLLGAILCMCIGAYAADVKFSAIKSAFSILVNGKAVKTDKPVVTINGDYYISVRQVSDAFGVKLNVNSKLKRIELGEAVKPLPESSISNPSNLNVPLSINYKDYSSEFKATIMVKDIIRGDEAWQMIQAANMFNSAAPDGYQYMLAKISFTLNDIADDKAYDLSSYSFKLISSSKKEYESNMVVEPNPVLSSKLYKGSSAEGWVVFTVKADDSTPIIAFGRKYDGTGGVWFKGYK